MESAPLLRFDALQIDDRATDYSGSPLPVAVSKSHARYTPRYKWRNNTNTTVHIRTEAAPAYALYFNLASAKHPSPLLKQNQNIESYIMSFWSNSPTSPSSERHIRIETTPGDSHKSFLNLKPSRSSLASTSSLRQMFRRHTSPEVTTLTFPGSSPPKFCEVDMNVRDLRSGKSSPKRLFKSSAFVLRREPNVISSVSVVHAGDEPLKPKKQRSFLLSRRSTAPPNLSSDSQNIDCSRLPKVYNLHIKRRSRKFSKEFAQQMERVQRCTKSGAIEIHISVEVETSISEEEDDDVASSIL